MKDHRKTAMAAGVVAVAMSVPFGFVSPAVAAPVFRDVCREGGVVIRPAGVRPPVDRNRVSNVKVV